MLALFGRCANNARACMNFGLHTSFRSACVAMITMVLSRVKIVPDCTKAFELAKIPPKKLIASSRWIPALAIVSSIDLEMTFSKKSWNDLQHPNKSTGKPLDSSS
jgi:hypothetical protein